jgi:hypothetical protein
MKIRNRQEGAINLLLASLIFTVVLLVSVAGFAAWAFTSRQDYKDNSDKKAAATAEVAVKNAQAAKDNEYLEKEKYPLKSFAGPDDLGKISFLYPKTWSGYVSTHSPSAFIFDQDVVSANNNALHALKITIEDTQYNDVISQYDGQVEQGALTATAYSLPKVSSVVGVKFDGEVQTGQPGSLVVLPLRDKTIEIACQIPDRLKDFNKIVLPNISFNP